MDDRKLVAQLVGLERRTSRSGKDSVDHGPGGKDDLINAVAGAAVEAASKLGAHTGSLVGATQRPLAERELFQFDRLHRYDDPERFG